MMLALLTSAAIATAVPPLVEPDLVIRNVTVIDPDTGAKRPGQFVAIADGSIVSVDGIEPHYTKSTKVVEAAGQYLIPGLWDAHVHSVTNWPWHAPVFMAHGITSVRNMHTGEPEGYAKIKAIKAQGVRGEAPRMIANGHIVDGEGALWPQSLKVANDADAMTAVAAHIANDMDFVKVYDGLSHDAFRAVVREAHAAGLQVAGHIPFDLRTQDAIAAGQDIIEHGIEFHHGCSDWDESDRLKGATLRPGSGVPDWVVDMLVTIRLNEETRDLAQCRALTELMARNGTVAVPTLINGLSMGDAAAAIAIPGASRSIPASILADWRKSSVGKDADVVRELRGPVIENAKKVIPLYGESGVTVLAGTDVGNRFLIPGTSLHQELQLMVETGMTPREALAAATTNPARVFGIEGLGCIASGCIADLVLLAYDPLTQIHNTRSILGIVMAGRFHAKAELDTTAAQALADWEARSD